MTLEEQDALIQKTKTAVNLETEVTKLSDDQL